MLLQYWVNFNTLNDLVNRDRIWIAIMYLEKGVLSPRVVRKSSYWLQWTRNRLVRKRYVVRQMLMWYWVNFNTANSRTHIEQQIELFGKKVNIFNCKMKNILDEVSFFVKLVFSSLNLSKKALLHSYFSCFC